MDPAIGAALEKQNQEPYIFCQTSSSRWALPAQISTERRLLPRQRGDRLACYG